MTPSATIITGNIFDAARDLPDNHFQCAITSPPYYAQRDYRTAGQLGREGTVEEYVSSLVAGFNLLAPKLTETGTLAVNIGDTRRDGVKHAVPSLLTVAMITAGWNLIDEIIWIKSRCRPLPHGAGHTTPAHEPVLIFSRCRRPYFNLQGGLVACSYPNQKRRKSTLRRGSVKPGVVDTGEIPVIETGTHRLIRSVMRTDVSNYPGWHTAAFPIDLPMQLIGMYTERGDHVLDPFSGTGTTVAAAVMAGRHGTGIEINAEYAAHSRERIAGLANGMEGSQ